MCRPVYLIFREGMVISELESLCEELGKHRTDLMDNR